MSESVFDWDAFLTAWEDRITQAVCQLLESAGLAWPSGTDGLFKKYAVARGVELPEAVWKPMPPIAVDAGDPSYRVQCRTRLLDAKRLLESVQDLLQWNEHTLRATSDPFWTIIRNGGLRSEPATPAEIAELENRLGCSLPDSYREFLNVSNGWLAYPCRLLPAHKVAPLRIADPIFLDIWAAEPDDDTIPEDIYDVYGPAQQYPYYRMDHLRETILVSESIQEIDTLLCVLGKPSPMVNGRRGASILSWRAHSAFARSSSSCSPWNRKTCFCELTEVFKLVFA